jgi:general secretion pathway protein M
VSAQRLIDTLQGFWSERDARERRMLALGAAAVFLALIYLVGIAPAATATSRLQRDLPQLRQQALSLQAMAREAQALAGSAPQQASLSTQESIEAALTRRGIKAQSVVVTGELVRVQLNNASFAGVLDWIDEMQKVARLSVIESSFTAQAQTDIVNATVSLRQPKLDEKQ